MYARLQIFIQLSPTMTKLCHVKCDHPACVSVNGGHFGHIKKGCLAVTVQRRHGATHFVAEVTTACLQETDSGTYAYI